MLLQSDNEIHDDNIFIYLINFYQLHLLSLNNKLN